MSISDFNWRVYSTYVNEHSLTQLHVAKKFTVSAYLLGESIDLKRLTEKKRAQLGRLFVTVPDNKIAVLFRYGVLVCVDMPQEQSAALISQLRPFIIKPYGIDSLQEESLDVALSGVSEEGVENDILHLKTITRDHLDLIAEILSRSVLLDLHEQRVANRFEKASPIAHQIIDGHIKHRDKDMLKYLGLNLLTEQELAGRIEVTEKPALLWEHPELDALYMHLYDEFEIADRQSAIDGKLQVISKTAQTYLDVSMHHHGLRLEWYIIALISLEIILQLVMIGLGQAL